VRTIGLLGGMSWESTAVYYRLVNEEVQRRLGGFHSAELLLHSVDFHDIEGLQAAGDWDTAGRVLAAAAAGLEEAGAELLVLCTNTMHLVAPAIEAAVGIPLLHIADVTAEAITAQDRCRPGLLGTAFTMEQPFYRERLAAHGLEVSTPEADDRRLVHDVIYDELVRGVVREESRRRYRDVMRRLVDRGADSIVFGCTEIELLVDATDTDVPVFPTTALHARAAVDRALAESGGAHR
jgi:aspartate racemase